MDPAKKRIIDLLEVVSEGKPLATVVSEPAPDQGADLRLTPEWEEKIAQLVREEVGRLFRGTVEEEVGRLVQGMVQDELRMSVRQVLAAEAEKALEREIARLKSS